MSRRTFAPGACPRVIPFSNLLLQWSGTRNAPLSSNDLIFTSAASGPLPPVTTIFCAIEGGKQYASWQRLDAHDLHLTLLSVMMR